MKHVNADTLRKVLPRGWTHYDEHPEFVVDRLYLDWQYFLGYNRVMYVSKTHVYTGPKTRSQYDSSMYRCYPITSSQYNQLMSLINGTCSNVRRKLYARQNG